MMLENSDNKRVRVLSNSSSGIDCLIKVFGQMGFRSRNLGDLPCDMLCVCLIGNERLGAPASSLRLDRDEIGQIINRGVSSIILVTDSLLTPSLGCQSNKSRHFREDLLWFSDLMVNCSCMSVNSFTIKIGYCPDIGHVLSFQEACHLLRYQPIRQVTTFMDLVEPFRLLLSDGSSYLMGDLLYIDGGAHLSQIPPLSEKHCSSVYSFEQKARSFNSDFDGRNVLVTGASSGIGKATALELAKRNANVILVSRRENGLEDVAECVRNLGRKAWILPANLTDNNEAETLLGQAVRLIDGPVHSAVYAAGQLGIADIDNSEVRRLTLQLNFASPVELMSQLVKHWKESEVRGSFVMVSSVAATMVPVPRVENYASSKAAVTQYLRALAVSTGRYGFRFNAVCPGIIDTPMGGAAELPYRRGWLSRIPLRRVGKPEEVARIIVFLLSPTAELITGTMTRVDGGFGLGNIASLADLDTLDKGIF